MVISPDIESSGTKENLNTSENRPTTTSPTQIETDRHQSPSLMPTPLTILFTPSPAPKAAHQHSCEGCQTTKQVIIFTTTTPPTTTITTTTTTPPTITTTTSSTLPPPPSSTSTSTPSSLQNIHPLFSQQQMTEQETPRQPSPTFQP